MAIPLGLDFHIGLDDGEFARTAQFIPAVEGTIFEANRTDPQSLKARAWDQCQSGEDFNSPEWRRAEIPGANGHGNARAVDSSWSGEMTGRPVISPDGRTAAVAMAGGSEQQIWVKQLDRGPAMRVADLGTAPSWSPDGRSLLFTTPGDGPLQTVPADGSVLPSGIPGRGESPQF